MTSLDKQASRSVQPSETSSGIGIAGAVVGLLVVGIAIAVAWILLTSVLSIVWLGFKIAVVLGVILAALVLVGMFRVHVLRR